jgi:hypothetical protein
MCWPAGLSDHVSVVFHQKIRQVLLSHYILVHQILAAKGQGLKTVTSGKQAANVKMLANISKAEKSLSGMLLRLHAEEEQGKVHD